MADIVYNVVGSRGVSRGCVDCLFGCTALINGEIYILKLTMEMEIHTKYSLL